MVMHGQLQRMALALGSGPGRSGRKADHSPHYHHDYVVMARGDMVNLAQRSPPIPLAR